MTQPVLSDCDTPSRATRRRPARTAGRLLVVAGLLAGPLVLPPILEQAAAATEQVNIQNLQFTPPEITANVGDEIVWTSHDPDMHGVQGGPMHSPDLHNGDTFRFTVAQPGDISYTCRFHPNMHGTIRVAGSGGGSGPVPAPGAPAPVPAPAPAPAPAPGDGLPDIGTLLAQLLGGLLGAPAPHSASLSPAAELPGTGDVPKAPDVTGEVPKAPDAAGAPRPDSASSVDALAKLVDLPQLDALPKLDLPKLLDGVPALPGAGALPALPAIGSLPAPDSLPKVPGIG